MPASRLSSVDLPEPDGPIRPRKSPSGTLIDTRSSTGISIASRLYDFGDVRVRSAPSVYAPLDAHERARSVKTAGGLRITASPGTTPLFTSTWSSRSAPSVDRRRVARCPPVTTQTIGWPLCSDDRPLRDQHDRRLRTPVVAVASAPGTLGFAPAPGT